MTEAPLTPRPRGPLARERRRLLTAELIPATAWRSRATRGQGGKARVAPILLRRNGFAHWADDYADRVLARVETRGVSRQAVVQSSMSPSGAFHVGNLRDTVTAYLVVRALADRGHRARLILAFDDYDAVHDGKAGQGPLRDLVGAPMSDAHEHARRVCRDFITELKHLGICPVAADPDGRGDELPDWSVRYQSECYRAGTYVPWQRLLLARRRVLARTLGLRSDRLFRPYCRSCGRNTTRLLTLSPGKVVYGCTRCGARHRERDPRSVKPSWTVDWMLRVVAEGIDCEPAGQDHCAAGSTMDRTFAVFPDLFGRPQPVIVPYGLVRQCGRGKVSGSRGGGLRATDLLMVMPPTMVLWLFARVEARRDLRLCLDLATLNRWHREYDAFLNSVRTGDRQASRLWHLLSGGEPDPAPRRAFGFRGAAGRVSSHFFDLGAATAGLSEAAAPRPRIRAGVAGRTGTRPRLVSPGATAATSWARRQPAVLSDLPVDLLRDPLPAGHYHAIAWALFGTSTAPRSPAPWTTSAPPRWPPRWRPSRTPAAGRCAPGYWPGSTL